MSKASHNPHESLTDSLIETALRKEFGTKVRLESYKVIDFTKKGDNYATFVTSVQVDYDVEGKKGQRSYIAKINHHAITEEQILSVFRKSYLREPIALGPILESMNKQLKDIGEPPIKAPRCLASCVDFDKEILLAEDLRSDGFNMADKMKGMDFAHATFVMEELGRFHACSILYEKQLKGSTIEKTYPPFDDPFFYDPDHPGLEVFSKMLNIQVQTSMDILNYVRESERVNRWWKNIKDVLSYVWNRNAESSGKFNVFVHGDCWNNNMLFRYNENGEPIDFRLVDFQMVRRSSPASDIIYFFYSSLTGEVRQKYKKTLLVQYYLSFSKILMLALHPVPFTFQELEQEFQDKMLLGCVSGMLLLPTTLVRPEDALEIDQMLDHESEIANQKRKTFFNFVKNSPAIKTRFLSMFDEMTESGVFDKVNTIYNPFKLLTENLVEEALHNDVGNHARLITLEVRNFTNKGDNYCSIVNSVKVRYEEGGSIKSKLYVVKLNPQRSLGAFIDKVFAEFYQKEIFMLKLIVDMSLELEKLQLPVLRVPKLLSCNDKVWNEIIIMNNLKLDGFVMFDRRKGIDLDHGLLIMEELGRFHASSLLHEDALKQPLHEKYPQQFTNNWITPGDPVIDGYGTQFGEQFMGTIDLLTGIAGYEKVIDWIKKKKDTFAFIFFQSFKPENTKFNILNHGDCWNNNFLFKYDEAGKPIDLRLVDFQCSKIVSVACDLNYFLYSSTNGYVRKRNLNQFLVQYYLSFCQVLLLAGKTVPFSFEELREEVKANMIYGCVVGMILLPLVLEDSENSFTLDEYDIDNADEFLDKRRRILKESAAKSDNFTNRFLSMFDEMMERGVIK